MRALVVHPGPSFSVADVYNGVVKGLRQNGLTVVTLNLNDRLDFYHGAYMEREGEYVKAFEREAAYMMAAQGIEVACYETWPDIVVIMSGWFVPPYIWGVLAKRPHHVVYWCTESPYEDDRQSRPARYADTVILNDPANLDWYRDEINPRTYYLPHSYDPDVHHVGPPDPELACDFGFVGTGFPSRVEFLEQVDWSGIDVKLGGNWQMTDDDSLLRSFVAHDLSQCMDNTTAADLYRSAKVSANLYRKEHSEGGDADGWAMGPREVELAACGTFFLREPRPEGDELLWMLPTFSEPEEFGDLVRYYLGNFGERMNRAHLAREAVANRTFKNTTAELLRIVDRAPVTV